MTDTTSNQATLPDGISENEIADYLTQHPDFFERHRELLTELSVPHPADEQVISLIERQVLALREQNQSLENRYREMVAHGEKNEEREAHMQATAVALMTFGDIDSALSEIPPLLCEQFDLVAVTLRSDPQSLKAKALQVISGSGNNPFAAMLERVRHGRSVCDHRLAEESLAYLFGDKHNQINSCALVPLKTGDLVYGIMAFGAADNARFNPAMGTVYLDRLGELVGVTLAHLISAGE